MAWKSILKPSESVVTALGTAAAVFVAYQTMMPPMCEVYAAMPHDPAAIAGQRKAMWTATGITVGAYLLTRDPNVFFAGGVSFLALEWMYRHAVAAHPENGKMVPSNPTLNLGYSQSGDSDYEDADYGSYQ